MSTFLFILAAAVVVAVLIMLASSFRRMARRVQIDEAKRREQATGSAEAMGLEANTRRTHNGGIL